MKKEDLLDFYNRTALSRSRWKKRNRFYHTSLQRYFRYFVASGARVIEIGCGPGDLLHSLQPAYGVGVDFSPVILEEARKKYPQYTFIEQDAELLTIREKFDYIILSDLVGCLWDVQKTLKNLRPLCDPHTRILISNYNYLWEPIMLAGEQLRLKLPQPRQNWLSTADLETLLYLEDFQLVTVQKKLLLPKNIPVLNTLFNRIIGNLPLINQLSLVNLLVARPLFQNEVEYSVSVVIPARNEKGNIENAILRTPKFGSRQEFIFVEGHSSDGTFEEMLRVKELYSDLDIKVIRQSGKGKGNAVRDGFDLASGDILMILDADLTMPPEELQKFYQAIKENKGEFVNGCRLVYPMEKQAMRFLNLVANKFFGWFFSHLLGQRLKDTLCGTKVLFRRDYLAIAANRSYFGDFDPFGDFDLLFGAAKLNLKITEIIIRYRDRSYGSTQISRFRHGWLLIRMSLFAARKIKYK